MQSSSTSTKIPRQRLPLALPFFYGWVIVACVAVAGFMSSGITNVVMSVLLKPITEETGWSRTMISTALGIGAVLAGVVSPLAGRWVDRFGARVLLPPSAAIVGVLYLVIAQAAAFPVFLFGYAANRMIAWSTMMGVVGQTAVANWFFHRRPRALGIVGMVGALGGSAMAVAAQFLLEHFGWRSVMVIYGVLTLALVVGPSALLLRRQPEDVGLEPDGFSPERAAAAVAERSKRTGQSGEEVSFTLQEALRTPALWLIVTSACFALFGVTSVSVHQIAYFTDRGIAPAAAAGILAVYTFSSAISNLVWGLLTERFDERLMAVIALSLAAAAVWYLTLVETMAGAMAFAVVFGVCARGENTLINIVLAQYFGRGSFGAISGFTAPFQTISGAVGPIVAALAYDLTDSYVGAFYVLIGCFVVAAGLMFLARRPVPPGRVLSAEC